MEQARTAQDDIGRIRQLMDAGHRGPPIGGEVLVGFGVVLALLPLIGGLVAFGYLPLSAEVSPLAAAAVLLAFAALVVRSGDAPRPSAARALLLPVVAGGAGELVWRATLAFFPRREASEGIAWAMGLGLLGLTLVALFASAALALLRLRRHPAARAPGNRLVMSAWIAVLAAFAVVLAVIAIGGLRSGLWFGLSFVPSLFWILWGVGWWISAQATGTRWMMLVAAGSWVAALWSAYGGNPYASATVGFATLAILPGLKLLGDQRRAADEA